MSYKCKKHGWEAQERKDCPYCRSKAKGGSLLSDPSGSDEEFVLDAGMEIEEGLAWLQAGHILIDGSDAPEWMHRINGCPVEEAAKIISQNVEMDNGE